MTSLSSQSSCEAITHSWRKPKASVTKSSPTGGPIHPPQRLESTASSEVYLVHPIRVPLRDSTAWNTCHHNGLHLLNIKSFIYSHLPSLLISEKISPTVEYYRNKIYYRTCRILHNNLFSPRNKIDITVTNIYTSEKGLKS